MDIGEAGKQNKFTNILQQDDTTNDDDNHNNKNNDRSGDILFNCGISGVDAIYVRNERQLFTAIIELIQRFLY